MVTTDGTIADIPRENYQEAEERVISELKELGKPFVVLINSIHPGAEETRALQGELAGLYDVPVILLNCMELSQGDLSLILEEALYEFPVRDVTVRLAPWVEALETGHWLKYSYDESIDENVASVNRVREVNSLVEKFREYSFIEEATLSRIDLGKGEVEIELRPPAGLFEKILTEYSGEEITGDGDILRVARLFLCQARI